MVALVDGGEGTARRRGRLRLEVVRQEGDVTVFAEGDLDVDTTDLLRDELSAHVRDASVGTVIVDAAALAFVDSTGIGTLVRARRLAEEHGTAFRVRRPAARLADLLERTGLTQLLLAP